MKLFSNTRAKRSTAFMVLLVWLFALASGVANACLLEARQTHSHIATAVFSEAAAHASVIVPGHAGAVADGVDESHFKAPCLKVCDDGTRSLPKQDSTVAQIDPGPAPLVLVLWNTVAPVVPTLRHMDVKQPATPKLPIRVRFSRLAI
ncbi:hypothetical protein SAMN05216344_11284 [Polaromonas sp. OV174]|uniref:hypothetical protein n=1 Tax=Polaromonas sp. OV174 TaxID=1855300 RepID=UPI0008EF2BE9|nr:hypothetical protein [Polaromonas sp. OV174]SFC25517.1 hypothetical protein SAMN05216344_11284 [Polaromonas sp. OV174]